MKLNDPIVPILKELNACERSLSDYDGLTVEQAWESCQRCDDMLWLFSKLYPEKKKEIIGASARCANTVRHLMTDERSTTCVDVCIAYSKGKATEDELKVATAAAYSAAYYAAATDADSAAAYSAAYYAARAADSAARAADYAVCAYYAAAYAARAAAYSAAYYAAATDADSAAYYAARAAYYAARAADSAARAADYAYAARKKNQLETAEICRKYLKLEEI